MKMLYAINMTNEQFERAQQKKHAQEALRNSTLMDPALTISADHLKNETLGLHNLIHESNESSEKLDKFQNELAEKIG